MKALPAPLRAALFAVPLAVAVIGARAAAQEPATPTSAASRITLIVDRAPDSTIDVERLRAAIARELGAPVVWQRDAPGGTLVVKQEGDRAILSFDSPDGRHDGRSVALEADAAQTERDIALAAVNVARDQVSQFAPPRVSAVVSPSPSSPASPLPARETPRPSPCDASGPHLAVGVDFLPWLGVSTTDRGRSIRNFSLGALGDLSGGVHGVALSGVVSADLGSLCGVQVSGVANLAGDSSGAQIAGVANSASNLHGAQIAGVVNVASGDASGAQIGTVNVAAGSMRGVQIGVVNYGRDADFQLGLLNINPGGRFLIDAWSKPEMGLGMVGLKHGGAHYHWIYGIGTRAADPAHAWAALGVGAHVTPADDVYVDLDAVDYLQLVFRGGDLTELYELRAVVGYRFFPELSVFAGPSYSVAAQRKPVSVGAPGYASVLTTTSDATLRGWPGIVLGVEGL